MAQDNPQVEPDYRGWTLPVHLEIEALQVVLAQPEMRELLGAAEVIAVGDCGCRRDAAVCDHPLNVCLAIDDEARGEVAKNGWREISLDDALSVLERSHRAGLVHLAYRRGDAPIRFVCSCCTCACVHLKSLAGRNYADGITESAYVVRFDPGACVACGRCVERCPFAAVSRAVESGSVEFRAAACFGCGLCVTTCPTRALSLVPR